MEKLVGFVRIHQRDIFESGKNIIGEIRLGRHGIYGFRFLYKRPMKRIFQCAEGVAELLPEQLNIFMLLHGGLNIRSLHLTVSGRYFPEQFFPKMREGAPIFLKGIQFFFRNSAEHGRINIPGFCLFRGIHIPWNIQIIVIPADFFPADFFCEFRNIPAVGHRIYDSLDVAGTQPIVFTLLDEALGCVDNENIIVLALLLQHHDDGRNAGPVENIRRQPDNCIDMILFNQIPADFSFFTAAEKNPVGQNNSHDSVILYVEQIMKQECIIGFALRR